MCEMYLFSSKGTTFLNIKNKHTISEGNTKIYFTFIFIVCSLRSNMKISLVE